MVLLQNQKEKLINERGTRMMGGLLARFEQSGRMLLVPMRLLPGTLLAAAILPQSSPATTVYVLPLKTSLGTPTERIQEGLSCFLRLVALPLDTHIA